MRRTPETAYLGLGGNIGDPAAAMAAALRIVDADPGTRIVAVSSLYRTRPWGKIDQPDFLNAAASVSTRRSPRELLDLCLAAELRLKRVRAERWGPRLIDMDILWFGDRTIAEDGLEVPHPRMLERAFVLAPLAEIASDLVIDGQPVSIHLGRLDTGGIEKLPFGRDWWMPEKPKKHETIQTFNDAQVGEDRQLCETLRRVIDRNLPEAESKIWHAHPVWFLDGNPIVGYSKLKNCIRLLFWSGQSFETPGLAPEGSFKAAEMRYTSTEQIDERALKQWIEEAKTNQWDYKNLVKKGRLDRLS